MPLKAYTKGQPRISRHFCGDMHPDGATGSVYHGSQAHISRPSLDLCQGGRFPRLHWQMEKVEEQIPSWRIVVLCAETRFCRRLCARTFQYILCMASSVRRGVSPATPLRTGFIQRMLFRTAFGTDLLGEETPCQGYIQFLRFQFHPMREPSCQGEEIKNAAAVRKPLHFYF